MRSRSRTRIAAAVASGLALCVLLAGCGSEPIRDLYYAIDVETSLEPGRPAISGTVRVSPLVAQGFVAGRRIVYRTAAEPLQVQRYAEYLWADVPAAAVARELLAALRAAQVFDNAVAAGDPARASHLLSGELTRFEHRPTAPRPHVLVELTLLLVEAQDRRLLLSETYTETEPTPRGAGGLMSPEQMIGAFNRALGRIFEAAVGDIRARAAPGGGRG